MGFRTVIILDNDRCGDWENDPLLGQKISSGMNHVKSNRFNLADLGYGRVVECEHTSLITLAKISGLHMDTLEAKCQHYHTDSASEDEILFRLLKDYVNKLGFNLTKKRIKKS